MEHSKSKASVAYKDYSTLPNLSGLEQELLKEYQSLLRNLTILNGQIERLTSVPTPQILDMLRSLELKTSLVYTLFKASVYNVFVQNQEQDLYQQDSQDEYNY